jgi:hypothetical protein
LFRDKRKAKDTIPAGFVETPEMEFLHYLRTFDSHYLRNKEATMTRFGNPDDATIRKMTIRGARQIAEYLGLTSLSQIVELVL